MPVLSTDETGWLSRAFNNAIAGLQERERLHEALGAFVDPGVVQLVLDEGTVLEGVDVEVTVLFLDIRDFTAFAERSSAREVVARLNEFYEGVVPCLIHHGGHANKFVGDGLLGVFGAPEPLSDHADRAVAAAVDVVRHVRRRYRGELRVGVGLNSGEVVAGTIGGGGRVDFTVIGDTVNTAARVEEVTRRTGDDILITEATRALLRSGARPLEPRTPTQLKGRSAPTALWAVPVPAGADDGEGPAPGGVRAGGRGRPWPAGRRGDL